MLTNVKNFVTTKVSLRSLRRCFVLDRQSAEVPAGPPLSPKHTAGRELLLSAVPEESLSRLFCGSTRLTHVQH